MSFFLPPLFRQSQQFFGGIICFFKQSHEWTWHKCPWTVRPWRWVKKGLRLCKIKLCFSKKILKMYLDNFSLKVKWVGTPKAFGTLPMGNWKINEELNTNLWKPWCDVKKCQEKTQCVLHVIECEFFNTLQYSNSKIIHFRPITSSLWI